MKIHLELDEIEYDAFREWCENYKKLGPLSIRNQILEEERRNLMRLIEKELPNKALIISCGGLNRAATYYLEEKEK